MKRFAKSLVSICLIAAFGFASGQTFTTFTTTQGLPDNFCSGGVAIDNNNNVWVGTALGLAKYDGSTWTTYTTTDGLVDNYVLCVAVDGNNVWAGTSQGLSKFDGTTWTTYTIADGLADNTINYLFVDHYHYIWAATGIGVNKFDGAVWSTFTTTNGLLGDDIKYMTESPANILWVGALGGYSKYIEPNIFTNYSIATIDSLASDNVFAIAIKDNGDKYIGTWNGISVIDTNENWVENIRMADGLYNNFVQDIKIAPNGDIWVGCFASYNGDGGVSWYDVSADSWTSYSVTQGLADMQVVRLAPDQNGDIWVATGNGLTKISDVTAIDESEAMNLTMSPNPANDFITLTTDEIPQQISILNACGQVVHSTQACSTSTTISTSGLPAGLYLMQVKTSDGLRTGKFIIE